MSSPPYRLYRAPQARLIAVLLVTKLPQQVAEEAGGVVILRCAPCVGDRRGCIHEVLKIQSSGRDRENVEFNTRNFSCEC